MDLFLATTLGYLLGSIPTSVLAGRLVGGIDIRDHGSGNAGASNVLRVLGWRPAVLVLAIDLGKGALAVILAPIAIESLGAAPGVFSGAVAGLAAVFGHVWPIWTRFRGGKGVATAAGAMGVFHPTVLIVAFAAFAVAVVRTRRIAVGSIAAAIVLPLATYGLDGVGLIAATSGTFAFATAVAVLVPWTHRSNIRRIRAGTESRLGE